MIDEVSHYVWWKTIPRISWIIIFKKMYNEFNVNISLLSKVVDSYKKFTKNVLGNQKSE